ncbi:MULTISPECIES: DUF1353 domain-containing protein [unclassified Massilia]|uniref:DUF1353 domain-containing protein n=1 Tax=unclassified Massilia TaxID=2609279 RepID=UPI00177EB8C4|nr:MULTISPECIES: DUF1353 domain-containing protein [unclassified Massilia]MBD8531501.1 DUF1353 domain-containing protein [Massilia sp. CFBP 13647]MBD8673703.1 DUF1353 domain-containing protein [Massilia sp. CFBP 13721]
MSAFLTRLALAAATDRDDGHWVLCKPLEYQSDVAKQTFIVPAGFKTDLASVPRLPVVYVLTGDSARAAAVVHDYLYSERLVSRKVADAVLREASEVSGVPAWRSWMMWAGVRIGGSSHYAPAPTQVEPGSEW